MKLFLFFAILLLSSCNEKVKISKNDLMKDEIIQKFISDFPESVIGTLNIDTNLAEICVSNDKSVIPKEFDRNWTVCRIDSQDKSAFLIKTPSNDLIHCVQIVKFENETCYEFISY